MLSMIRSYNTDSTVSWIPCSFPVILWFLFWNIASRREQIRQKKSWKWKPSANEFLQRRMVGRAFNSLYQGQIAKVGKKCGSDMQILSYWIIKRTSYLFYLSLLPLNFGWLRSKILRIFFKSLSVTARQHFVSNPVLLLFTLWFIPIYNYL